MTHHFLGVHPRAVPALTVLKPKEIAQLYEEQLTGAVGGTALKCYRWSRQ